MLSAIRKISPVPIDFKNIENDSKGYYNLKEKRIAIQENMSELHTLKTVIHEIAHAKLHDVDITNGKLTKDEMERFGTSHSREVVAESIAFVVCDNLGLDTSDYSFKYIAGWSSGVEMEELKENMNDIQKTSHELLDSINKELDRSILSYQEQKESMEQSQETPSDNHELVTEDTGMEMAF